jgi:hypothetical protein
VGVNRDRNLFRELLLRHKVYVDHLVFAAVPVSSIRNHGGRGLWALFLVADAPTPDALVVADVLQTLS